MPIDLVQNRVTPVAQTVLNHLRSFALGGACALDAAQDSADPSRASNTVAIANDRTYQTANDGAAERAGTGLLFYLFRNLLTFHQVELVLLHVDTGGIDNGFGAVRRTTGGKRDR